MYLPCWIIFFPQGVCASPDNAGPDAGQWLFWYVHWAREVSCWKSLEFISHWVIGGCCSEGCSVFTFLKWDKQPWKGLDKILDSCVPVEVCHLFIVWQPAHQSNAICMFHLAFLDQYQIHSFIFQLLKSLLLGFRLDSSSWLEHIPCCAGSLWAPAVSLCGAAEPSVPTSSGSPSPTALVNVNVSKDAN